jgi:hypothetical protein
MTPRDHNKTLGIAFGLIGMLMLIGLMVLAGQEVQHRAPAERAPSFSWELSFLPLPLLHLLTSYGLFRRRRWGRLFALIFSVLYVAIFPLGTALAVYTWWFMHSAAARSYFAGRDGT